MALHDKIRDELYGPTDDGVQYEVAAAAFSDITDSVTDTHSGVKVLTITVTAEVALISLVWFARDKITAFLWDNEYVIYVALVPFVLGFLTAFTAYRMLQLRRGERGPSVATGIMSGFAGHDHRTGKIWIWFTAAGAGFLNTLAFFALLTL